MNGSADLRLSPLDGVHRAAGARMVPFGGWDMPVSYPTGTIAEHMACRQGTTVFDVSHLGSLELSGPGVFDQLQAALSNDLRRVRPGRAQYTHLLEEADASVVDDIKTKMAKASGVDAAYVTITVRDATGNLISESKGSAVSGSRRLSESSEFSISMVIAIPAGKSVEEVRGMLRERFVPVMKTEWCTFFPYNLVSFSLVPPLIRPFTTGFVLTSIAVAVLWLIRR